MRRSQPVAHHAVADALERLAAAQREQAEAIAEVVEALRAAPPSDPDELVPHTRWPWTRRRAAELACSGAIVATKDGKLWLARRSALDAYVASLPATSPRRPASRPVPDGDEVAQILARAREVA